MLDAAAEAAAATAAAEAARVAAEEELLKVPLTAEDEHALQVLVYLCRQQELNDEQTSQLLGLISDRPHLFRRPDGKGIAPVHWLCGSPAVTESHLMALLDSDASLARCRDSRGILPLHWSACEAARTQRAAATPLCRFAHLPPPPSPGSAQTTR